MVKIICRKNVILNTVNINAKKKIMKNSTKKKFTQYTLYTERIIETETTTKKI